MILRPSAIFILVKVCNCVKNIFHISKCQYLNELQQRKILRRLRIQLLGNIYEYSWTDFVTHVAPPLWGPHCCLFWLMSRRTFSVPGCVCSAHPPLRERAINSNLIKYWVKCPRSHYNILCTFLYIFKPQILVLPYLNAITVNTVESKR